MSDTTLIRIGILIAGAILFLGIWLASRRPEKAGQGRRVRGAGGRSEPTLGDGIRAELDEAEAAGATAQPELGLDAPVQKHELGRRADDQFDKIVSLFVAARAGRTLRGPDIVVAAEKAGLVFGYMNVFHRLIDRKPEDGPVFSVANIMKPGSFDMAGIHAVETPAIAFFLTLPAPVSALEAWETMEPTAQRMAELLDGVVLDSDRNALGRQRIGHIREELRAYDRQREAPPLTRPGRW
ncbi:cell division protein ZipA [Lysobacter pythonis]|uniref:Cell division protein ZipA n=1 Tax=Solilutibacter pythonis TaxID=2483112 RepID=A0A3M2I2B2_9GAMM|nr:cell division protein ZipA [Lysobacter pythonis]RMH94525.1 cell division protein ZipA [Lysobacter pythonis]